mmetsp:Transcript_10050/g.15327  ORF Transcript_10050/g.15327 Transcript_10050/m.15327 type:complete len:143 (-) Transcript_10050:1768-2196(-)
MDEQRFGGSSSIEQELTSVPHSGWHSQRFCVYPQELVIQFSSLVKISSITFLVHQFKIPKQIDLYYFVPPQAGMSQEQASQLIHYSQPGLITFKKLGHFSLDDNMKTNFQAREMKTVHVECSCQFLKIVFSKNHQNQKNIFN